MMSMRDGNAEAPRALEGGSGLDPRYEQAIINDFHGTGARIVSLPKFAELSGFILDELPLTLRILLEATLRGALDGKLPTSDAEAPLNWLSRPAHCADVISFHVGRLVMQDAAGLPLLADFAALRDAAAEAGMPAEGVQPVIPVDLVVDHSVQIDQYGHAGSLAANLERELIRNRERYSFLRWAAAAIENFRVVPPGNGIVHQIHMESLAEIVSHRHGWIAFDTVVGTDSHTTMIGGLGILGWGVGGIEAEAAMLGVPLSFSMPEVIGLRLIGRLKAPAMATDAALSIARYLRQVGVVGAFIEATGPGCATLTTADRATIANMAPEYGATCVFFPVDAETLRYAGTYGHSAEQIALIENYCRHQRVFYPDVSSDAIKYSRILEFNLGSVTPVVAGPTQPHGVVPLSEIGSTFGKRFETKRKVIDTNTALQSADIVIAAITSCTNTANPAAMITAGLVARAALENGLRVPGHVKTSFAPGSRSVPLYLNHLGLLQCLERIGFHVDAFGCTTCVGNSGDLSPQVEKAIADGDLAVVAVLSGNRNFEARIHPLVQANFLMSPALVVAFALAGRVDIDLEAEPICFRGGTIPIYLRDLWPDPTIVEHYLRKAPSSRPPPFTPDAWQNDLPNHLARYAWSRDSEYFVRPPFFEMSEDGAQPIRNARPLLILGDNVTTDHISPVGRIDAASSAAAHLRRQGTAPDQLNTYAARRGNHEVMKRGTFANVRLANALVPQKIGPWTRHLPSDEIVRIDIAADRYMATGCPTVILAGKNYGAGSARDWAAKGTRLLGVRAVLAVSFERIHRSNLVCLGVAPIEVAGELLSYIDVLDAGDLVIDIEFEAPLRPRAAASIKLKTSASIRTIEGQLRVDSAAELQYLQAGGILPFIRRRFVT